jgi:hypothetical protein
VNPELPGIAVAFADAARQAIPPGGGVQVARRAQADPALRATLAGPLLDRLGIDDLDPRGGLDAAAAAAQLCRVAGGFAFPYPVAARLAAPPGPGWRFVAAVDTGGTWVDHADLPGPWLVVDTAGAVGRAEPLAARRDRTLAPFATRVAVHPVDVSLGAADRALVTTFDAFTVLGAAEQAHALAVGHVRTREQFGGPLAGFQGVQFRVADCAVAVRGLQRLAHFTLWRLFTAPQDAVVDALALRVSALETASLILSNSHLLHGAVGFCDEHDLTTLDRSVQASLRLPTDLERTSELLFQAIDAGGFHSLFDPREGAAVAAPSPSGSGLTGYPATNEGRPRQPAVAVPKGSGGAPTYPQLDNG